MSRLQGARVLDGIVVAVTGARLAARGDRRAGSVARVLAARQLIQAALLTRYRSDGALRIGAGVDGLHGITMLGLAAADPPRRREALASALSAATFTVASLRATR